MHKPQVSIIVPIYNVKAYLQECLQSLISQSYENLDIILVDDASSDESLNIALEFAKKDKRIFIISKPNGGLSSARNTGIEFIKGSPLRTFFEKQMKNYHLQNSSNSQENSLFNPQNSNSSLQEKVLNDENSNFISQEKLNTNHHILNSQKSPQNSTQPSFITSFTQSHSFSHHTHKLSFEEITKHFYVKAENFIQSTLRHSDDFIIQALPENVFIHFVDSDDYLDKDCIRLCVKKLLSQKAELCLHSLYEFKDGTQEFTMSAYLNKIKKQDYDLGLDFLNKNKLYNFYFSWQGLFKADILNRYALRFTQDIYHEDHDFGTLLFALTQKITLVNEPLYFYRQRINSIMNSQKESAFPQILPHFLENLRKDFGEYKALRAYYRAYCFVRVGLRIWEFYAQKSEKNEEFKQKFEAFFAHSSLAYAKIFKISLKTDPLDIKGLCQKMHFSKALVLWDFVKDLHRQPKKILYFKNIKHLLSKER